MRPQESIAQALKRHREDTERALAVIRSDRCLDDVQKGRHISAFLAEANARFLALQAQHRHVASVELFDTPMCMEDGPRCRAVDFNESHHLAGAE